MVSHWMAEPTSPVRAIDDAKGKDNPEKVAARRKVRTLPGESAELCPLLELEVC